MRHLLVLYLDTARGASKKSRTEYKNKNTATTRAMATGNTAISHGLVMNVPDEASNEDGLKQHTTN